MTTYLIVKLSSNFYRTTCVCYRALLLARRPLQLERVVLPVAPVQWSNEMTRVHTRPQHSPLAVHSDQFRPSVLFTLSLPRPDWEQPLGCL